MAMLIALFGLLVFSHAAKKDILVLSEATFDASISSRKSTLVEFYAPWCGHCKKLAPHYAEAAGLLPPASLAKVDCTVEQELCARFDIKGFPTIKLIRNDFTSLEYSDARTSTALVSFMKRKHSPAYTHVTTLQELEELVDMNVVVGFFSSDQEYFLDAANKCRDDDAVFVSAPESLAPQYGTTAGHIALLTNFDNDPDTQLYTGSATADELTAFVRAEAFPLLGVIGPENFKIYTERGLPIAWLFVDYDNKHTNDVLAAVKEAAVTVKGVLSVVQLASTRWQDQMRHFGLHKTPALVIEERVGAEVLTKYIFDETKDHTDTDAIQDWLKLYMDGDLEPSIKSEKVPSVNDGPVTIIVGTTFQSLVQDSNKNVFLEFYAPWCGHCKTLAPRFDDLGVLFKDDESVMIAKIDVTANDVPVAIKGFPTLVFFPSGDGGAMEFDGERSVAGMAEYIHTHIGTPSSPLSDAKPVASSMDTRDHGHDEL